MTDREKHISVLKDLAELTGLLTTEQIESLNYAISSLETDLFISTDPNYTMENLKEDVKCLNSIDIKKDNSILADVRNEIEKLMNENVNYDGIPNEYAYCYQSVLEIIDKYLSGKGE